MLDNMNRAVREKEQAFRAIEESDRLRNQAVRAMEESNHKVEEARRIVSKLQAEITFLQERLDEAKGSISSLTADLDRTREEREDLKMICSRPSRNWLNALSKVGSSMKPTKRWTTILKTSWTVS